jgi:hypothetical protein
MLLFLIAPADAARRVRLCLPNSHYKPLWMRVLAVGAVMATLSAGVVNYNRAGQLLQVQIGKFNNMYPEQQAQLREGPDVFTERWFVALTTRGNLDGAPKAGRPYKINDTTAMAVANILSSGYDYTYTIRGQRVTHHKYFTSVPEAVKQSQYMRDVKAELNATNEQLRVAVHRVAPEVEYRRVSFKHMLTAQQKAKRMSVSAGLLARHHSDPTLLHRMVFVDESSILTHGLKHDHVQVWMNSSDAHFQDYHGVPGSLRHPVKAHVVAAVSAHPAFASASGLVYMDFTTGTTAIHRRINKRLDGSQAVPDYEYWVSVLLLVNAYNAISQGGVGQAAGGAHESIDVAQLLALEWHPLVSVARAQHNPSKTLSSSQGGINSRKAVQVTLMHPHHGSLHFHSTLRLRKISSQHHLTTLPIHVNSVACPVNLNVVVQNIIVEIHGVWPKFWGGLKAELLINPQGPQHQHKHLFCWVW